MWFSQAVACQRPSNEKVSYWCSRSACYAGALEHLARRLNWPQLLQFNHPAALMQPRSQRRLFSFIVSNPSNNAVLPNPSLKRSANGMSRWPASAGPAAHFALAVHRAMPSSPA